jgi:hypothetical protein
LAALLAHALVTNTIAASTSDWMVFIRLVLWSKATYLRRQK